jgi:hypothetical protein
MVLRLGLVEKIQELSCELDHDFHVPAYASITAVPGFALRVSQR